MYLFLTTILIFIANVLPMFLVLVSKKASGTDKFIWFLFAFLTSWLGYFVYYFLVVKNKHSNQFRAQ